MIPASSRAVLSASATGVTRVPGPYPAAIAVLIRRAFSTLVACCAISRDLAASGGSGKS